MSEARMTAEKIRQFLKLERVGAAVPFAVQEATTHSRYIRQRIEYVAGDGDHIPAFLLIPEGEGPFPAALVHHQHASQRHLGKSEVAGIAGDPLQAFGPALARRGFVVLAPDSICFEDRRKHASGITQHPKDDIQHFVEMGHRLTQGDTLMRKVLADASSGISVLMHHPKVAGREIGVLGHSYGGNTTLFQAALDSRIAWAVSSGSLCSYAFKRQNDIPLEMALIIPGFAARWDLHHLVACIAPRPLCILSAGEDPNSMDAGEVISRARPNDHVTHFRGRGGHALTPERFNRLLHFIEFLGTSSE